MRYRSYRARSYSMFLISMGSYYIISYHILNTRNAGYNVLLYCTLLVATFAGAEDALSCLIPTSLRLSYICCK